MATGSVGPLAGPPSAIAAVEHDELGSLLVTGHADGRLLLRAASTGEHLRSAQAHAGWVGSVCAAEIDDQVLIVSVGRRDGTLRLWDPS